MSVGESHEYAYFRIPTCLGNHEAKARAQQLEEARLLAEEKHRELQVGQCVEC